MFIYILLFIATCFLSYSIISTIKWVKLKITIHNIPYFLIGLIIMTVLINTALINPSCYFIMCIITTIILFILESVNTFLPQKKPFYIRLMLSIVMGCIWIHLLAYLVFYLSNSKIINEKLKS